MAKGEWSLDAAARTRIDTALSLIYESFKVWPECVVCGQHASLDKWGCCSKVSITHMEHGEGR